MISGRFLERIRQSPTTKLAIWGCILVWEFFFILFSIIMTVWTGAVMRENFSGWLQVFLEWAIPVFIIITTLIIIYRVSKYSRSKLGVMKRVSKPKSPDSSVEI